MNYNDLPGLRWSTLKPGLDSPLAMQYALANPRPDSAAKSLGRAVHMLTLEGRDPPELPAVCLTPSGALSTSAAAKAALAQLAADGIDAYAPSDIAAAREIAAGIALHPIAAETLALCRHRERAFTATIDGEAVKCQADLWSDAGILADLKTTSRRLSSLRDVQAEVLRWGYHGQLAWYRRVIEAAGGEVLEIRLIVSQTCYPFDVAVVTLDDAWLAAGDELVSRALTNLAIARSATASGIKAPGAFPALAVLDVPRWMGNASETFDDEVGF